jgi:hypothetical protein
MSRMTFAAALLAAVVAGRAALAQECAGDTYGTAVTWIQDEAKAVEKAREGRKLLLVVHLSGELDDAQKT